MSQSPIDDTRWSGFEIHVEDPGAGFDVEKLGRGPDAGFGLFSVREQIARLGGTVDIESTPRRGTRVSLRVPVAKPMLVSGVGAPAALGTGGEGDT